MTKKLQSARRQAGFSLVEMIIAGVLMVGMLLAAGVFNFSGDQSKATNILEITKELGSAATRYNADTSLNPKAPAGLFDNSKTTSTDTFEGKSAASNWKGPYINGFAAGTNGEYPLTNYLEGASATFAQITTGLPVGASTGYQVVITGLAEELTRTLMGSCNGTTYTASSTLPSDHAGGAKCSGSINATTKIGTVGYLYRSR